MKKMIGIICTIFVLLTIGLISIITVKADYLPQQYNLYNSSYENSDKYSITEGSTNSFSYQASSIGTLNVIGNISKKSTYRGVDAFEMAGGALFSNLYYKVDSLSSITNNGYSVVSDSSKTFLDINLDNKINQGVLIFQKSNDLNEWNTVFQSEDILNNISSSSPKTINMDYYVTSSDVRNGTFC